MTYSLSLALGVILSINVLLFFGQEVICDINPNCDIYFDLNNTAINDFNSANSLTGNYELTPVSSLDLPDLNEGTSPTETNNIFVDAINSIKNWFAEKTGFNYLLRIVNAVPNTLKIFGNYGVPASFIFGLSALWHAITLFLVVSFIFGRSG